MSDIDAERIRLLDGTLLLVLRELLLQRRTTIAAERLGMSQSAVSHALKRLRRVFDDPLFTRLPHGLEPTQHALDLGPKLEVLLSAMTDALGPAEPFDPATSERDLVIGAPDHVATLISPALVHHLAAQAPNVRFAFRQILGDLAIDAVRRGDINLALGRFGRRVPSDLRLDPLYEDRYCLVARGDHPRIGRRLTMATYSSLDHVQISVTGDLRNLEIERFLQTAAPRRTVASVPRFEMALGIAATTDAVALAPRRLAVAHGARLGLRVHELPFEAEPIRVALVRQARHSDEAGWLDDTIRNLEVVRSQ